MTKCSLRLSVMIPLLATLWVCAMPASAQFGSLNPTGVNAAFFKLFGSHTNFSADVEAQVLDKDGKDWVRLPLSLASLESNIAMDVDISKAVSRDIPEFTRDSLKQAGMHQMRSIVRADKKATFLVYPGARSFLNMPLPPEDVTAMNNGYRVETKPQGKEMLDNKERSKNKVVVRDSKGVAVLEAVTWTAPDLKNFPVKIETRQENMTVILQFKNVQFARPDPSKFELPTGYTEYTDMRAMMFGIMRKIAVGATGTEGAN